MNIISRVITICERRSELVTKVYRNVCFGLLALSGTCLFLHSTFNIKFLFTLSRLALIPSILIPMFAQFRIRKISDATATLLFYSYAISLGVLLCPMIYLISSTQLLIAVLMTGGLFYTAMYISRNVEIKSTDLKLLNIGILVLLAMSIANLFLRLRTIELLAAVCGMAVFVGLSAYEISEFEQANVRSNLNLNKISMVISLSLLSKIINLFIYAVNFLRSIDGGRNRD